MRVFVIMVSLLFLLAPSATATSDVFTVTNSPFGFVHLTINSYEFSLLRINERDTPPPLEVWFTAIIHEIDAHRNKSVTETDKRRYYLRDDVPLVVVWDEIRFVIDPKVQGMTLSYRRKWSDQRPLGGVVLTVPSEEDKNIWQAKAKDVYLRYTAKFWEAKEMAEKTKRMAEEANRNYQKRLEKLHQGPVKIYP